MRKDIKEEAHEYIMKEIKPNYAAMARSYDCDPRTVKRYYEEGIKPKPEEPKNKTRPSKLDGYREIIKDKLELSCSASNKVYVPTKLVWIKGAGSSKELSL